MKGILITLLFLCLIPAVKAQTNVYVPFPTSNAQWNDDWSNDICDPNYPTSCWDDGYYLKISHDTVINSLTYHLINFAWRWSETTSYNQNGWYEIIDDQNDPSDSVGTLIGAIREDTSHRIYYRSFKSSEVEFCIAYSGDTFPKDSDILIYDFNLNVGDTTSVNIFGYKTNAAIVTSSDSVLVGSTYRKVLELTPIDIGSYDVWCEGIGSLAFGLLDIETPISEAGCTNYLDCFLLNNSTVYTDADATGCDSIVPYYHKISGINTLSAQKSFLQIFPNPTSDELFLTFSPGYNIKQISIYNYLGQLVYKSPSGYLELTKQTIDVSNFPAGLYFVKAMSDAGILTSKFLKQ